MKPWSFKRSGRGAGDDPVLTAVRAGLVDGGLPVEVARAAARANKVTAARVRKLLDGALGDDPIACVGEALRTCDWSALGGEPDGPAWILEALGLNAMAVPAFRTEDSPAGWWGVQDALLRVDGQLHLTRTADGIALPCAGLLALRAPEGTALVVPGSVILHGRSTDRGRSEARRLHQCPSQARIVIGGALRLSKTDLVILAGVRRLEVRGGVWVDGKPLELPDYHALVERNLRQEGRILVRSDGRDW
jgi:hypothetical protein